MVKPKNLQTKSPCCSIKWITAASVLVILLPLWAFSDAWLQLTRLSQPKSGVVFRQHATAQESDDPTFYDDPTTSYTIDKPMTNWDEKRSQWMKSHPNFATSENRVLIVTGSQPSPCKNPAGDHFLLRLFKNKVDYCRTHGFGIFYNNAFMHPKMRSLWAKLPILRAAMVAHPHVEWLLWMDSDAIFTDMDFTIPFERYEDYNLVVHGWPEMIYEKKSWLAANTGTFLIRNCQWSMDFLDVWARMGPMSRNYQRWGEILRSTLSDKTLPESDDQSSLIYILLRGEKKWGEKIYVENKYSLHAYWLGILDEFDDKYEELEKLRRRHAEVVSEDYAAERGRYAEEGGRRLPFVTTFTGCQPCSGAHNPPYEWDPCTVGMERALKCADNQVLKNYGFVHADIGDSSLVTPLPFDYRGVGFDQLNVN